MIKRLSSIKLILVVCVLLAGVPQAIPGMAKTAILKGTIVDYDEQPVAGAEVYAHETPNVKRPADFISNRTSADGKYLLQLPAGKYWTVAVFRKSGGRFGPLGSDDRHSGEPVELDFAAGQVRELDFTVVDLRQAAREYRKENEDLSRIRGRIINHKGRPVAMAYVMVHPIKVIAQIPRYLSAWTGPDGKYSIYLPSGDYYIGAATEFPPENGCLLENALSVAGEQDELNVVLKLRE